MSIEPLVVYWAPASEYTASESVISNNWNLMYPEPTNLHQDLLYQRNKSAKENSFFLCPAVTDRVKRTFVFRNNTQTSIHYDTVLKKVTPLGDYSINSYFVRPPSVEGTALINFALSYIFFCEESLTALMSPPTMHDAPWTKEATLPLAGYDVGKWFRKINFEIQAWKPEGELTLNDGDPLFYMEFITDRPVVLKRFELNNRLGSYTRACIDSPGYFGKYLPLTARYKRFMETKMNRLVINEIKRNLVEND
jgi:hypothetical protein